jgi:hypothetical protein
VERARNERHPTTVAPSTCARTHSCRTMPLVFAHDLCSEQLEPRQFDDAMQFHVPRASLLLIASSVEREQRTTIRFGLLPICTGFRLGLSAARSGLEKLSVRAPASRMRFQWLSCHVSSSLFGHALSTKARLCKIGVGVCWIGLLDCMLNGVQSSLCLRSK